MTRMRSCMGSMHPPNRVLLLHTVYGILALARCQAGDATTFERLTRKRSNFGNVMQRTRRRVQARNKVSHRIMFEITSAGRVWIDELAQRHGVSAGAVTNLLQALIDGGGTMAQFNHPELGGMGQWVQGGMTMVGSLFDDALK